MRSGVVILVMSLAVNAWAAESSEREAIEARIKPIGQVRLAEQTSLRDKKPSDVAQTTSAQESPGKLTYEKYCSVCHRDGLAGSPKFRIAADWQPRLDKKNLDELVVSSVKGLNAMPAKGTCSQCSDAALKDAIQYMLPQP